MPSGSFLPERREAPIGAERRLLQQILGVGGVPRHPQRSSVEAGEQREHIPVESIQEVLIGRCRHLARVRHPMTSIPGAPPCAFAGRHNYKAVGRLGHARARPQTVRTPPVPGSAQPRPRSALVVVLVVAGSLVLFNTFLTQAASTPVPFSGVPEGDRQRRPREGGAGHDHDHHDQRCGRNRRMEPRPTWRRSRPGTSPPTSSTTSARGAMRSTGSSRTR